MTKICIVCGNKYTKLVGTRKGLSLYNWEKRKFCSIKCAAKSRKGNSPWNKGQSPSAEVRAKISKTLTGRPTGRTGDKSHFWRGGTSRKYDKLKNSMEWKNWRRAVFERDDYTCQECGAKNYKGLGKTIELHPHHIKDRKHFPELQFEVSNGQTLCVDCHRQTDNYGCKANSTT